MCIRETWVTEEGVAWGIFSKVVHKQWVIGQPVGDFFLPNNLEYKFSVQVHLNPKALSEAFECNLLPIDGHDVHGVIPYHSRLLWLGDYEACSVCAQITDLAERLEAVGLHKMSSDSRHHTTKEADVCQLVSKGHTRHN